MTRTMGMMETRILEDTMVGNVVDIVAEVVIGVVGTLVVGQYTTRFSVQTHIRQAAVTRKVGQPLQNTFTFLV